MADAAFGLRGVVEGFYGTYYTFPERNDLIRFLGKNGFNFYLYGPKNDRQHRARWWEPYPPAVLDAFAETIRTAQAHGVTFCYAIAFGMPLKYLPAEELAVITAKLGAFYDRGCRSFAVLLDDLPTGFALEIEGRELRSVAGADADCCNRLHAWARSLDTSCSLYVCPTDYHGTAPFSTYLHDLGRALHPDIGVFYTGPSVCSARITAAHAALFGEAVGRPPVIWDNYPVNDIHMRHEMHLGPLRGRDPFLHGVCAGFISNVMGQAEASKVPLLTVAEYLRDPHGYEPGGAWERAILQVAGEESAPALRQVAETSLGSCLQAEEAPRMDALALGAMAALHSGESVTRSEAVAALSCYLDLLDELGYHLRNRMANLALRRDLIPWIEALDERLWLGRGALRTVREIERGGDVQPALSVMEGLLADVRSNPKRIGGEGLLALAAYAMERARFALGLPSPADPLYDGALFRQLDPEAGLQAAG